MAGDGYLNEAYEERSDAETRARYDKWAATYDDELVANDYRQPARCAALLAAMIDDRATPVFDAGCGTGLSGAALREVGFTTIDGCDFSAEMLARAEATGAYRSTQIIDLNRLPLAIEDDRYGATAIVGVFSFGHVKAAVLDELVRVTQPGGALVIGMNELYYAEGSVVAKLDSLAAAGKLQITTKEVGDHLPGHDLAGWVLGCRLAS